MTQLRNPQAWLWLAGVYVVALTLNEVRIVNRDPIDNPQVREAQAWHDGRLNLLERKWDTAFNDGKTYSHFPPMFTFLSYPLIAAFGHVPHATVVVFVVIVPALAFLLFLRLTPDPTWAGVLTIALVFGTSAWPIIEYALRSSGPYELNHLLALIGLLIFLSEYFGRRRVWVLSLGMLIGFFSRQMLLALAVPLLYAAIAAPEAKQQSRKSAKTVRVGVAVAAIVVAIGGQMTLNYLKFSHPLESGYMLIYAEGGGHPERDDRLARDARAHGNFSAHFVPRNLYYANVGLPRLHRIEIAGEPEYHVRSNTMGTGIWWTSPVLIWLFFELRSIGRDRARFALLIAAGIIFVALLFYHNTGWQQRGINRFSLDYVPILFALIAPAAIRGRRRWITVAMIGWSVLYFGVLLRPHVG